jgi:tetratricopeptide (TPR) repeat protein
MHDTLNLDIEVIADNQMIYLEQSYQKALRVDPTYKAAAECLAIVLTDIGTNIKLAGNTQEGIQKYFEALKIDPHYAVILFQSFSYTSFLLNLSLVSLLSAWYEYFFFPSVLAASIL